MEQITFQQYKALHQMVKKAQDDLNTARYALERMTETLANREQLIFDNKSLYERLLAEVQKQNKHLKHQLSKHEHIKNDSEEFNRICEDCKCGYSLMSFGSTKERCAKCFKEFKLGN